MLNDTLGTALSNIKNAEAVGKESCIIRVSSKLIAKVLELMNREGYIGSYEAADNIFRVNLLGKINNVCVIKPRFSVKKDEYEKFEKRFLPAKDFGILILSTQTGLLTHKEAKQKGIGGRLISYCY